MSTASAGTRPAISCEGLERTYRDGFRAVDGIDLAVAPGEVYGFLGPNGAGKTTTVRMLVTLLRPTGGRATVAGHDVATDPGAVRRRIGVALQEAALDPLMTGRELVRLQATLHGVPRREVARRADDLLERVDLTAAATKRSGTYSGGMRRRLDLAMALVHEPEVLFLDEPTTGLDPVSRRTLWDEVRRLQGAGTTVFLTTQYLEEADELADRVGIIAGGRLAAEGSPAELKAQIDVPRLEVVLVDGDADRERARALAAEQGALRDAGPGVDLSVEARDGAAAIAPLVRALDDAGVGVAGLELVEPTLEDVFAARTGQRLTADDDGAGEPDGLAPAPAGAGR